MKTDHWIIPFFFTLLIGFLLVLSIPVDFDKYRISLVNVFENQLRDSYEFADVDGDGSDDLIECGGLSANGQKNNNCAVRSIVQGYPKTIDQINVTELSVSSGHVIISDFDHDKFDELSILDIRTDSIFLAIYEGPDISRPILEIPLDSIARENGLPMVSLAKRLSRDINDDGYDELFISLSAGFSIYPRRNYRIDIKNKQVLRGLATSVGFNIIDKCSFHDSLLTGQTTSPDNHHERINLPFPDNYSYIYVLNEDLDFHIKPIVCAEFPNYCRNIILDDCLFTLRQNERVSTIDKRDLRKGDLLAELKLEQDVDGMMVKDSMLMLIGHGVAILVDPQFSSTKIIKDDRIASNLFELDVDNDGLPEYISNPRVSSIGYVFSNDLDSPVEIDLAAKGRGSSLHLMDNQAGRQLVVHREDRLEFYSYHNNALYWLRWPYYLLIFGLSGFGSSFLFRAFRRSIEQRYEQEKELNRLQLLSIKNQVDPHFTLNALNSIDWMYRNNEPEKASSFMGKLTRLMHQTVSDSDKFGISLYEELNFCRNYCELEKLRNSEFNYNIQVATDVDPFDFEVPKQLIFTHVENAIKHGLRPKRGDKELIIDVKRSETGITIEVLDNGIGYKHVSKTTGTQKGLSIAKEMSKLYESINGISISHELDSKSNNGTKASVSISAYDKKRKL